MVICEREYQTKKDSLSAFDLLVISVITVTDTSTSFLSTSPCMESQSRGTEGRTRANRTEGKKLQMLYSPVVFTAF